MQKNIKKILLISLSNIGDAVMTTPVVEYLHNKYPDYLFDIVCDKKSIAIFENCPYLNKIYIKDKTKGIGGNINLIKVLRKNFYEIAVDLRTDFLLYFLKAKNKFFKVNNKNVHSVIKHFSALKLDSKIIPKQKIWIPPQTESAIKKKYPKVNGKILALGVGANSEHKIWPTVNFVSLAKTLSAQFNKIIILGDKRDNFRAQEFLKHYKSNVINLCGQLSLIESAAFLKNSTIYIGNDSGLGHISSALDIPTFIVFGAEDSKRYHPWGTKSYWFENREKKISLINPELILMKIKEVI
jgi:heptosyltransferase-3